MARLVRDGEILTTAEVATTRAARRRGLLGRDHADTALVLQPCRQVHTVGMRFALDVIWCDRAGHVLRTATVPPRRVSRLVLRSRFVIEAPAGATERWNVRPGDVVDLVEGCVEGHATVPEGRLVLVGTPIGNLGDLSPRAADVLSTADVIAAEDTRRTRALLTHIGVSAGRRLQSVHAQNEAAAPPRSATPCRPVRRLRSSPTPGCRASPIPAPASCAPA